MYSSIKKKYCKCGCGKFPTLSCNGFNYNCLSDKEKEEKGAKRKLDKRLANNRQSQVRKIKIVQKKVDNEEQEKWFTMVAGEIAKNPHCWNCGEFIPEQYYRAASGHIFPKRKDYGFPSVATHPMNFLILGPGCGCHSKFDRSINDASKMKVWPIAVVRFNTFADQITERHKYLSLFIEAINGKEL